MSADFEAIKTTDPIVSKILASGGSLEDCIVALVAENRAQRDLFGQFEIAVQRPCITLATPPQDRKISGLDQPRRGDS